MPKLSEVVLPVLAGLVSAASPYAARGVGAGLDVYQTMKRRKAQQDAAAAEEARRQALAQALMGGQGPYGDAARQLAQAGAVEPALGLFTEGIRSRAKQDEDRAEQLRRSLEPPAPPKVETRTEEDPSTGQKYAVRYENGVRVSAEPVFGRPAPRAERPDRQWQSAGSYVDEDGHEVQKLLDPFTGEIKEQKLRKARVSSAAQPRGEDYPTITGVDKPEVAGADPLATLRLPNGEVQRLPLSGANALVRSGRQLFGTSKPPANRVKVQAAGSEPPGTAAPAAAVASPGSQAGAVVLDPSSVLARLGRTAAPERKWIHNPTTGETFLVEARGDQWVRLR